MMILPSNCLPNGVPGSWISSVNAQAFCQCPGAAHVESEWTWTNGSIQVARAASMQSNAVTSIRSRSVLRFSVCKGPFERFERFNCRSLAGDLKQTVGWSSNKRLESLDLLFSRQRIVRFTERWRISLNDILSCGCNLLVVLNGFSRRTDSDIPRENCRFVWFEMGVHWTLFRVYSRSSSFPHSPFLHSDSSFALLASVFRAFEIAVTLRGSVW